MCELEPDSGVLPRRRLGDEFYVTKFESFFSDSSVLGIERLRSELRTLKFFSDFLCILPSWQKFSFSSSLRQRETPFLLLPSP